MSYNIDTRLNYSKTTYKVSLVSFELNLENVKMCQVFDLTQKAGAEDTVFLTENFTHGISIFP